jgi:predicted nuclease of predicted toxin-antitoxin system
MAHLYADENFPLPVVEALRKLGHNVLTIHDDGKANQRYSDAAVLAVASAAQRAVLTLNRKHFRRLHRERSAHSGIILCTYDPDSAGQAQRINETIEQLIKAHGSLAYELILVSRPAI